jgi:hypothetical protein
MFTAVVVLALAVALLFLAEAGSYIGQKRRDKDMERRRGHERG